MKLLQRLKNTTSFDLSFGSSDRSKKRCFVPFSPYDRKRIAEFLAFESAQVAAFEIRNVTILFGVVTHQFPLMISSPAFGSY